MFETLKSTVETTPFFELESWPRIWRPDADRYHFEWCRGNDYYGVDRPQNDEDLSPDFKFLKDLVSTK